MEYLIAALEITMALFAVIGIYSVARLCSQRFFGARQLAIAIEMKTEEDVMHAEALVEEALAQFLLVPSGNILILAPKALSEHPTLNRVSQRYGVSVYVTTQKEVSST